MHTKRELFWILMTANIEGPQCELVRRNHRVRGQQRSVHPNSCYGYVRPLALVWVRDWVRRLGHEPVFVHNRELSRNMFTTTTTTNTMYLRTTVHYTSSSLRLDTIYKSGVSFYLAWLPDCFKLSRIVCVLPWQIRKRCMPAGMQFAQYLLRARVSIGLFSFRVPKSNWTQWMSWIEDNDKATNTGSRKVRRHRISFIYQGFHDDPAKCRVVVWDR